MTNEEIITKLLRQNLQYESILRCIYEDASEIHSILYCIGGGLNDNIKNYTSNQQKDLFRFAHLSQNIRDLSNLKEYHED